MFVHMLCTPGPDCVVKGQVHCNGVKPGLQHACRLDCEGEDGPSTWLYTYTFVQQTECTVYSNTCYRHITYNKLASDALIRNFTDYLISQY